MSAQTSHITIVPRTRHRATSSRRALSSTDVVRLVAGAAVLAVATAIFICDATIVGYSASGITLPGTANPLVLLGAVARGELPWPAASWVALSGIVAILAAATGGAIAVMRRF